MMTKEGYALLIAVTCVILLSRCRSQGEQDTTRILKEVLLNREFTIKKLLFTITPTVVIDGYTHNSTLTSGGSVLLGTQLILVCQVVGLPYGTPLSYTWTCPNGPCEVEGYYGRKIYNEHILAVNTTSTSGGGTYTCQVTATGGQEASGSFTLKVTGMSCTTAVYIIINK